MTISTSYRVNGQATGAALVGPSLRTFALAAVAQLVQPTFANNDQSGEIAFLRQQLAQVDPEGLDWQRALPAYLRAPAAADQPLLRLGERMGLSLFELLVVALARAVEDDSMLGRVLAFVQAPLNLSRPTLGLLAKALGETPGAAPHPLDLLLTGPAMQSGLLQRQQTEAPLPEQAVRVPLHLCLALSGRDGACEGATIGLAAAQAIPLPPSTREQAARQAAALQQMGQGLLTIRSISAAEGKTIAAAVARAMSKRPLFLAGDAPRGLAPWLYLNDLLPVYQRDVAPGERQLIVSPPLYDGPLLALSGREGHVETTRGGSHDWLVGVPPKAERQHLWERALRDRELAAQLARDKRHSSGRIAYLGRLACYEAALAGREAPSMADLLAATWSSEGGGLHGLAQPLADPIADEALVTGERLRDALQTLLGRCLARDGLADELGASATARYHPGVTALLVGPSGTGKTLAAGWLATRLQMPLYRVDTAAITSKYIGETEKNLALLLARAEEAEVVLLFDEADSLFGKRTEVLQANDRFANAQTNYLLQRIEAYDGIALLTSNSRSRFDGAFTRRLDLIVDFPLPGPEERRALWQSHLGDYHTLGMGDLNRLAGTADLAGGHIRNVVLAAAVLARQAGRAISWEDVRASLADEYRKLGRQIPLSLAGG